MDLDQLRTWEGRVNESNYYCPACDCRKSGDVTNPNSRDESCAVYECPCHNEDLTELPDASFGGGDHIIVLVSDSKYAHLSQPQCSCGEHAAGFSAYPMWWVEQHLAEVGQS